MPRLSLPDFVERWKASTLSERAASQSHFIDLCEILGQAHPAAADQSGENFTFEKHVSTMENGKGFADVWKRGFFGWEYKGKHKSLNAAYTQLVRYQGDLENPPLLVTCDQERFEVHTNFTGTRPLVYKFTLHDLLTAAPTANCALPPLEVLRAVFTNPDLLRPDASQARVTENVASEFAKLADSLEHNGIPSERAAHFLMRLLFCLFADSIGLLPDHLFRQMIETDKTKPSNFTRKLRLLFSAMSTKGSTFGLHDIHYFNGGLFGDDEAYEFVVSDMSVLSRAAALDWAQVEPAIFGTLFERSLNPGKRSQLGAHYTSRDDISLVVEPVLIQPLQARWATVKAEAITLAESAANKKGAAYSEIRSQLQAKIFSWIEELSAVRVLDPACGSGNFLYLALRRLLDLWHEARVFSAEHALPTFLERQIHPSQLYGLETNIYAQELASVVVWIGYLQWLNQNNMGWPTEPILRRLDNIQNRDAILARDADGKPIEPTWPEADFIIGNPPFLGGKRLRTELGDRYVEDLFQVYSDRVPREADLVAYWFEKSRAMIEARIARRAGLLATQGIRGGANREVLERIKESGNIFWAQSDREWILDGASVHVSMVGFDDGAQEIKILNGVVVQDINSDLTSGLDLTKTNRLRENRKLCFMGDTKSGSFDISGALATEMLAAPLNPNGRPNADVIKPWVNALDIGGRIRGMQIIDFGNMTAEQAALYERPFEHIRRIVQPERAKHRTKKFRDQWWIHERPRPAMLKAVSSLTRFIATIAVGKYRHFVWIEQGVIPDHSLLVFARDDDYFFGILHSRPHELWARRKGTQLREAESGFRYTPTSTFETFAFPWIPGQESANSSEVMAISVAARELAEKRDLWLNPSDASEAQLKKRTLTNLYNARPTWLMEAHRKLDETVFAAYGWPSTATDAQLLERLLNLNHERATSP